MSDDLTVAVEVVNVLESIVLSDMDEGLNTITENEASGTVVLGVTLQAVDEGGEPLQSGVIWNITPTDVFAINSLGVITYASTATVDYETTTSYTIVVAATVSRDTETVSGDLTLMIEVVNVLERIVLSDTDSVAKYYPRERRKWYGSGRACVCKQSMRMVSCYSRA